MIGRLIAFCAVFGLVLLAGGVASDAAPSQGRAVVIYDQRAMLEPLGVALAEAGWAVEHWIYSERAEAATAPASVKKLTEERYKGRLLVIAHGKTGVAPADPAKPAQPAGRTATITLRAYDSRATEIASATVTVTAEGPAAPIAAAVKQAGQKMAAALKKAGHRVIVEREYHLVIQLPSEEKSQKVAEPLHQAVVEAVVKAKLGPKPKEIAVDQKFDRRARRFTGTIRFNGTGEALSKIVDGLIKDAPAYRGLQKEPMNGQDELRYRYAARAIWLYIKHLDEETYNAVAPLVTERLKKVRGVTWSPITYDKPQKRAAARIAYIGDPWRLEAALYKALQEIKPLAGIELLRFTEGAITYRRPGPTITYKLLFTGIDPEFKADPEKGGKLRTLLIEQAKLPIKGDGQAGTYDDEDKSWTFEFDYNGRREALDKKLWALFAADKTLGAFHRRASKTFYGLHYAYWKTKEEGVRFRIQIEKMDPAITKQCDELEAAISDAIDVRDLEGRTSFDGKAFIIEGSVTMSMHSFYQALWDKVLSTDAFKNFVPLKSAGQTIRLSYQKKPLGTSEVKLIVKGVGPVHDSLYAKPFMEAVSKLTGVSDFELREDRYSRLAHKATVDGRFAGSAQAFVDAVETMRKKDKAFGPFLKRVDLMGTTLTYRIETAGQTLLLLGNLPKEKQAAAEKELRSLVKASGAETLAIDRFAEERYLRATLKLAGTSEVFTQRLLTRLASSTVLKGTVLRDLYANVMEYSLPSERELSGPFNRPLLTREVALTAAEFEAALKRRAAIAGQVVAVRSTYGVTQRQQWGLLVSSRGYLLCPYRSATDLVSMAVTVDGRSYLAQVVAVRRDYGLALLRIEGELFEPLVVSDQRVPIASGDPVIGFRPSKEGQPGLTVGRMTTLDVGWTHPTSQGSKGRFIEQSVVAPQDGIGLPLLDRSGRLIGLTLGEPSDDQDGRLVIPLEAIRELMRQIGG